MGNTTSAGIATKLEDKNKHIQQLEAELNKEKEEAGKLNIELEQSKTNETQPSETPPKRFYFFGGSKRKKNKRGSKKRKTVSSKKK